MRPKAFTLVEILLAVAIVAILATILLVSTAGLRREADIRLTESTLAVISTALRQYYEFWGDYPPEVDPALGVETNPAAAAAAIAAAAGITTSTTGWTFPVASHVGTNTYMEALYLRLYRTPVCRRIISSFAAVSDKDGQKRAPKMALVYTPRPAVAPATGQIPTFIEWGQGTTVDKRQFQMSLYRFVDAWRTPLRYRYRTGDPFPVLISNGPDRDPNTADDIRTGGI
jgi:prepilin-type N-terminal cleavage/methylation domain-containing protein